MTTPTCATCRFWHELSTDEGEPLEKGWCRRFPPTVTDRAMPNEPAHCYHPTTSDYDWCGEHQPAGKRKEVLPYPTQQELMAELELLPSDRGGKRTRALNVVDACTEERYAEIAKCGRYPTWRDQRDCGLVGESIILTAVESWRARTKP